MKHRRRLVALLAVVFASGAAVAACDLASDGIAMDAVSDASAEGASEAAPTSDAMDENADGATGDAPGDAQDADAGADGASLDSGTLHCGPAYVTNCLLCAGAPSLCVDTCVANCHDNCAAAPIQCFGCSASNAPSTSVCTTTADASACLSAPNQRCTCASTDAGECPGPTQVCNTGQCLACGEANTDMLVCKLGSGPHKCDNGGGAMKLTCH